MAQENVEIVRRGFVAWSRGDVTALIQGLLDPDVVLQVDQAGQGVYRGREGAMESLVDWTEDFDDFRVVPEEFLDSGDYVVVRTRQTGIGKASGVPMEGLAWFICQMREGKAIRVHVVVNEQAALEAAGLSEKTMSQENVEIVRLIVAAWAQGDFRKEAERLDPEIVFETFMPDAEGNVVARGVEDLAAYTRDWFAQWRGYRIVGEDFEAVGPDKVFASVRQIAAGGQSGVEVESAGFTVWTLREGRVVGLFLHYDRNEALKAAGLSK